MAARLAACAALLAVALAAPAASDVHELGPRIFGGDDAEENEFPTQVFLLSLIWADERSTFEFHFCGGTIISEKWILTAAHCVDGAQHTIIKAGSSDRTVGEALDINRIVLHEAYDGDSKSSKSNNDIALLELAEPLSLGEQGMAAARLPSRGRAVPVGRATAVGWGRHTYDSQQEFLPGTIQKLETDIIACPDKARKVICVQSLTRKGGICAGDLGGPLLIDDTVFGVASYVNHQNETFDAEEHCDDEGSWGAYTPVINHRLWIKKHTGV